MGRRWISWGWVVCVLAAWTAWGAVAHAQHMNLPPSLVALESPEGQRMLIESDAHQDFFALASHHETQRNGGYCAAASAVMVLNALQVPAPKATAWDAHVFTQDNLFNDKARTVIQPDYVGGMTLQQLADVIASHPATVKVVYASDSSLEEFRALVSKNLATPDDYVIVNYERSQVGQELMGHVSPIGAYDAKVDRFLVMDVARYKYPPVWVDAASLFRAMNTGDIVSGKTRGFLLVTAAATAPGPSGAPAPRSLIRWAIGFLVLAFLLGAALGAGVQTIRQRRRARAQSRLP
jgi:hypothetical protein